MVVFKKGIYSQEKKWTIIYDSGNALEPFYYWIIDYMQEVRKCKILKVYDWYSFSYRSQEWEAQQRKWSSVFQNANSLLSQLGQVIKSLVAIRKDYQRINEALDYYKDKKGKPSDMVLKGIWMDNVDPVSGAASFSQATKNLQFFSARDWFIKVKSLDEIEKIPVSDRIKNYLKRKYEEYDVWKKNWKGSLEDMEEILGERIKATEGTIKTYKDWTGPLLRDMKALSQKQEKDGSYDIFFDPNLISIGNSVYSQVRLWTYKKSKKNEYMNKFMPVIQVTFTIRGTSPHAMVKTYVDFEPMVLTKEAFDQKMEDFKKDPIEEWINNMMLHYEYGTKRKERKHVHGYLEKCETES